MKSTNKLAMQALHSEVSFGELFFIELKEFIESKKCCISYSKFYDEVFRQKIIYFVEKCSNNLSINLKYRVHEYNGLKFLKIYKSKCMSFLNKKAALKITENSKKIICKYLYEYVFSVREQVDLCPGFRKPDAISKPRIQIYHFSMSNNNNIYSIPPKCTSFCYGSSNSKHLSIDQYKDTILKNIKKNQVLIITHDIGIDKLAIPQFILENSSTKNEHCRIIYSNNQKFVAVKNSETIAKRRGEIIGLTTGYQIPLKSVSSCNKTNLLFTSSAYFLRCLMGVNSKETFYGITHVILDDVHERDFKIDLLLLEIREVLSFYPNLRIILLCLNPFNTKLFEDYFKKVESLNLKLDLQNNKNIQVHYLNKILEMINYSNPEMEAYINLRYRNEVIILNDKESQLVLNNILDRYINECDLEAYDKFCYLVQTEYIPVDVQHSDHLMNMLMGAAKNNKIEHIKVLLKMNANIYLSDFKNRTAQDWAKNSNSIQCLHEMQKVIDSRVLDEKFPASVQRLKAYRFTKSVNFEIDHNLIFELVKFLYLNFETGNILIIVPDHDDMLKIQYRLQNFFDHSQIKNYKIYKLHNNIKITEIDEIINVSIYPNNRRIIFSTEIVESFCILNEVLYVIDSGLIKLLHHTTGTLRTQWISKDRAERRKNIAEISEVKINEKMCFRIYTSQDLASFPSVIIPELMHIPLDNVCLFVKILSPYTTIKDYFMRTICTPSNGQIEKSIQLLKTIDAFEEQETITILGMRLIDIPLHVQLGKVLIHSIFMQCLDPVLTIISILQCNDHLFLPEPKNSGQVIYSCMRNLTEGVNSDHLTFLRIFQKWQDDRVDFLYPMSEGQFILDQNLQVVCEIRSEIVGIVRSVQLIHANGILSMNHINSFANNWATVKACFVAGMYPNISHIKRDHDRSDFFETQFKCNSTECIRKLFLYPGSVLRNVAPDSWNKTSLTYQTDWLFYQNCVHREKVCRIQNTSLITPITIAIFAGKFKKCEDDLINEKCLHKIYKQIESVRSNYSIDDWISFSTSEEDAYLIFNLRQKISHIFLDLLQNCDNHERLQRYRRHYVDKLKILEIISKVLQNEDANFNFQNLERVGERPKALPLPFFCEKNNFSGSENNPITLNNEKDISVPKAYITQISNQLSNETVKNMQKSHNKKTYTCNPNVFKSNLADIYSYNFSKNHEILERILLPIEFENKTEVTLSTLKMNILLEKILIERNIYIIKTKLSNIINKASPHTLTFYILPCWNKNDAAEYIVQNKFNKNCVQIWNEICLKFIENTNIIHYVFLFDVDEACFCFSGFLIWNGCIDGIRLHVMLKVDFTIDHIIARFKVENQQIPSFVHYVRFGAIHYELGYYLVRCMEMFEKLSEQELIL